MMFTFMAGPWQVVICLVVIALLFGSKKIPDLARAIGKAKGEFKKGLEEGSRPDEEKAAEPVKEIANS